MISLTYLENFARGNHLFDSKILIELNGQTIELSKDCVETENGNIILKIKGV